MVAVRRAGTWQHGFANRYAWSSRPAVIAALPICVLEVLGQPYYPPTLCKGLQWHSVCDHPRCQMRRSLTHDHYRLHGRYWLAGALVVVERAFFFLGGRGADW